MKENWKGSILYPAIFFLLLLSSCDRSNLAGKGEAYTCPMHPTINTNKPGSCPVCGMDLVRKVRAADDLKISEDLSRLLRSSNKAIVSSVKTIKPEYRSVPISTEAVGVVTYDTRNIYSISSRVSGRLERMYLKYEFQRVEKGDKIAEIYSPELVTAQRELLYLLENDAGNRQLIEAATHKLDLLGFSTFQINDMVKRREPAPVIAIFSPYTGYVVSNEAAPAIDQDVADRATASKTMGEMSSPSPSTPTSPRPLSLLTRTGDYISSGQAIVKLVNTSALRIELNLLDPGTESISAGDNISIDFGDRSPVSASVDFVQPIIDEEQSFIKIRVDIKDKNLFIGQLVRAQIQLAPKESLWLPRESVLDLGTDMVIFIKQHELLRPRKITTGVRVGKLIEVKTGLASSEEVAANAQYLVDSESLIKPIE